MAADDGLLCCIVAVKAANLGKKRARRCAESLSEECSVKLVLSCQYVHEGGDSMVVVARGQCLERLLGIPLSRLQVYLEELETSEDAVVQALSCKLSGQYALVSTALVCAGDPPLYSMTHIRLLPDNCATILSYPPLCQPVHTPQQLPSYCKKKLFCQSMAPSLCDSWTTSTPKVECSLSFDPSFPPFQLASQTSVDIDEVSDQVSSGSSDISRFRPRSSLLHIRTALCCTSVGSISSDEPVLSSPFATSCPSETHSISSTRTTCSVSSSLVTSSTLVDKCTYSDSFMSSKMHGMASHLSSDESWQYWTEVSDPTPCSTNNTNVQSYCSNEHSLWDAACCQDNTAASPVSWPPQKSTEDSQISQVPGLLCSPPSVSPGHSHSNQSGSGSQLFCKSSGQPITSSARLTYTPSMLNSPGSQFCRNISSQSCKFLTPSQYPDPLVCNSLAPSCVSHNNAAASGNSRASANSLALFSDLSTLSGSHDVQEDGESPELLDGVGNSYLARKSRLPGSDGLVKIEIPQDLSQTPELFHSQLHESCSSPELFPVPITPVIPKSKVLSRTTLLRNVRSKTAADT